MNLEVEVRDAELGVPCLTEEPDDCAGLDGTELAVLVEVGVVVLVAVHATEPDGRPAQLVALGFGRPVDDRQHRNAALADHVDALVPSTAATRSAPGIGKRSRRGACRTCPTGPGAVVIAATGEVSIAATAGLATARVGKR